jgi:hypothetical protein
VCHCGLADLWLALRAAASERASDSCRAYVADGGVTPRRGAGARIPPSRTGGTSTSVRATAQAVAASLTSCYVWLLGGSSRLRDSAVRNTRMRGCGQPGGDDCRPCEGLSADAVLRANGSSLLTELFVCGRFAAAFLAARPATLRAVRGESGMITETRGLPARTCAGSVRHGRRLVYQNLVFGACELT